MYCNNFLEMSWFELIRNVSIPDIGEKPSIWKGNLCEQWYTDYEPKRTRSIGDDQTSK